MTLVRVIGRFEKMPEGSRNRDFILDVNTFHGNVLLALRWLLSVGILILFSYSKPSEACYEFSDD